MSRRRRSAAICRSVLSATTGFRLHRPIPGSIAPDSLTDNDNEGENDDIVFGDTPPLAEINALSRPEGDNERFCVRGQYGKGLATQPSIVIDVQTPSTVAQIATFAVPYCHVAAEAQGLVYFYSVQNDGVTLIMLHKSCRDTLTVTTSTPRRN